MSQFRNMWHQLMMEHDRIYSCLVLNVELAYLVNCIMLPVFACSLQSASHSAAFPSSNTCIHIMLSGYSDVNTRLSIQTAWRHLMTSYVFLAIRGSDRTCGQSLFCQTSHWAKVLLPAKGCNLSHTWLVWPGPITASLSGSSVWQTVNQPGPLQEPWSWAARHRQHFTHNAFLQACPSDGELLALWT